MSHAVCPVPIIEEMVDAAAVVECLICNVSEIFHGIGGVKTIDIT